MESSWALSFNLLVGGFETMAEAMPSQLIGLSLNVHLPCSRKSALRSLNGVIIPTTACLSTPNWMYFEYFLSGEKVYITRTPGAKNEPHPRQVNPTPAGAEPHPGILSKWTGLRFWTKLSKSEISSFVFPRYSLLFLKPLISYISERR